MPSTSSKNMEPGERPAPFIAPFESIVLHAALALAPAHLWLGKLALELIALERFELLVLLLSQHLGDLLVDAGTVFLHLLHHLLTVATATSHFLHRVAHVFAEAFQLLLLFFVQA